MHKLTLSILGSMALLAAGSVGAADTLTPAQAAHHIGERATVCGTVASARFVSRIRGQPTFINLDKAYPDTVFTIVIWGKVRAMFAVPPETARGRLCVTGRITSYRGAPEIKVTNPAQLTN